MTNLDNIRKMNREELAEILSGSCCKTCIYKGKCCCNGVYTCKDGVKAWLEQEVPPKLTDDEKIILRNIDKKYKWIARDKNNTLCCYTLKPHKTIWENWTNDNSLRSLNLFEHLFQSIKWSDDEPYEISKLLGEEDLLDEEGICEDCGKKGIYRYEPYEEEINEKEIIVCLCDDCYKSRAEEI